jgi:hypothetical protein
MNFPRPIEIRVFLSDSDNKFNRETFYLWDMDVKNTA